MIFDFAEPFELRGPGLPATGPKMVCRELYKYAYSILNIYNPEWREITNKLIGLFEILKIINCIIVIIIKLILLIKNGGMYIGYIL